jgi:hypothetical protein
MPRDGAYTLFDVTQPTLEIVCEPCRRSGRYSVAGLIESYGDAKLTLLLDTLTECPKARAFNIRDLCKAKFGQPIP